MFILIKSYIMIIIMLITGPLQILLNAMPGSKAFSDWLKKTASYLLPYPICAAMFIFAAVLIGDPTRAVGFQVGSTNVFGTQEANPFGVNPDAIAIDGGVWLPPFTLTSSNLAANDLMVLIGFFVFAMTPMVVKMAQDWLQVKESPYTSEIAAGLGGAWTLAQGPIGMVRGVKQQAEHRRLLQQQSGWIGDAVSKGRTTAPQK
jgi:hypothetical protein